MSHTCLRFTLAFRQATENDGLSHNADVLSCFERSEHIFEGHLVSCYSSLVRIACSYRICRWKEVARLTAGHLSVGEVSDLLQCDHAFSGGSPAVRLLLLVCLDLRRFRPAHQACVTTMLLRDVGRANLVFFALRDVAMVETQEAKPRATVHLGAVGIDAVGRVAPWRSNATYARSWGLKSPDILAEQCGDSGGGVTADELGDLGGESRGGGSELGGEVVCGSGAAHDGDPIASASPHTSRSIGRPARQIGDDFADGFFLVLGLLIGEAGGRIRHTGRAAVRPAAGISVGGRRRS